GCPVPACQPGPASPSRRLPCPERLRKLEPPPFAKDPSELPQRLAGEGLPELPPATSEHLGFPCRHTSTLFLACHLYYAPISNLVVAPDWRAILPCFDSLLQSSIYSSRHTSSVAVSVSRCWRFGYSRNLKVFLAIWQNPVYSWPMLLSREIRHGRHCFFQLHVHLVFITKYRYRIFDGNAIERLRAIFSKVCFDFESQ